MGKCRLGPKVAISIWVVFIVHTGDIRKGPVSERIYGVVFAVGQWATRTMNMHTLCHTCH